MVSGCVRANMSMQISCVCIMHDDTQVTCQNDAQGYACMTPTEIGVNLPGLKHELPTLSLGATDGLSQPWFKWACDFPNDE